MSGSGGGEDAVVEALAGHDPLLAVSWGLPARPLPALDPDWWSERLGLWCSATSTSDRLLRAVAGAEVMWMEAGEFRRSVHATIDSPLFAIRQLLDEAPVATATDLEHYAALLASLPTALAGLKTTLREGLAEGTVAARRQAVASAAATRAWTVEVFVDRVDAAITAAAPTALAQNLRRRSDDAAVAFSDFGDFLQFEYAAKAREDDAAGGDVFGLWAGRYFAEPTAAGDWYGWAAQELAAVMVDLARVRAVAAEAGPSRVIHGASEHRAWVEGFVAEAMDATASIAPLPPGVAGPVVKLMPSELGSYTTYYSPPKTDSGEPGVVWVEPGDGPHYVEYEKVVVAHEGVPGHHTETSHQRAGGNLSRFQQLAYLPAHSEGWGLYAEQLADEADLYDTAHSRAGYLGSLALRLASAVIDLGIHCHLPRPDGTTWTIPNATALLEEVGLSQRVAESWLDSILGRPGHRSTYAIGKRAWLHARNDARRLGIIDSDFHQQALSQGPCVLSDLDRGARFGDSP